MYQQPLVCHKAVAYGRLFTLMKELQLYICPTIQKVSDGKNNTPNANTRQLFCI